MCGICDCVKIKSCNILVETKTGLINMSGKIEEISCFSDIKILANYCPICGRKLTK